MERKVALITGGAKRIGREMVLSMAKSGWNIAIHYNTSQNEAENTLKDVKSQGGRACIVKADLSDEMQVRAIMEKVHKELGAVSCLINNASVFKNDTVENFTASSWSENMAVNLYAPTILMQEFVRQLPEGGGGNIINMLDYSVWRYPERFMSYTASKAALWALTKQLAYSLAAKKIRVNAIGPGNTMPNQFETIERFEASRQASPLGIGAEPDEVCRALEFILSSLSMTGQMIALDGGKHLAGPEIY
jgi:NAD(P)-dependent dehydrogenase (short-subunit alcohol dehydrogenase family)